MSRSSEPLDGYIREFNTELPNIGAALIDGLRKAEFPVQHIRRGRGRRGQAPWLIHTKPAEHLRQSFGLAPELLLLILPAAEAFARDIEQAESALSKELRLDTGLVLVVAKDREASSRLGPVTVRTGRAYLFFAFEEFGKRKDPRPWLRAELRRRLGAADLFAPNRPVIGWDFFGRDVELKLLRQHLIAGKPVGLYGLRKTGKTSLALRCLEQLADEGRTLGLHVDLQALGPFERNLSGFMRRLIKSTIEASDRQDIRPADLDLDPRVSSSAKLRKLADTDVQRLGVMTLESTIDWAQREPGRRVILFIDEYERLFESELFPAGDARDILDYLRGLVQTYPGRFDFIIAGLTRRFAAQSRLGELQNPLFGFTVDFPLAGLEQERLNEMIRKIGKRVGLMFDGPALELIWQQSGGHPALARQFGRLVDRRVPLEQRADGYAVTRAHLAGFLADFALEVEPTMQEMFVACQKIDPKAPEALVALDENPASLERIPPQSREQLRRLGLVEAIEGGQCVAIGAFADWLRVNVSGALAVGA